MSNEWTADDLADVEDDELRWDREDTTQDVAQHRIEYRNGWARFKDRVERMTDGSWFDLSFGFGFGCLFAGLIFLGWQAFHVFFGPAL